MNEMSLQQISANHQAVQHDTESHVFDLINYFLAVLPPALLAEVDQGLQGARLPSPANQDLYRLLSLNEFPHIAAPIQDDATINWCHFYFSQYKYEYEPFTALQRQAVTYVKQSNLTQLAKLTINPADLIVKDQSGYTIVDWAGVREPEATRAVLYEKMKAFPATENPSLAYWAIRLHQEKDEIALQLAALQADEATMKMLVQTAIEEENIDALELLTIPTDLTQHPIFYAAKCNKTKVINYYLDQIDDITSLVNADNQTIEAIASAHHSMDAYALIQETKMQRLRDEMHATGAIVEAVYTMLANRRFADVTELLQADPAILQAKDSDEATLLSTVIANDDGESLAFLLPYYDLANNGHYAATLIQATQAESLNCVNVLLEQAILLEEETGLITNHPIHYAAATGNIAIYDALTAKYPAMVYARNQQGLTPLMVASLHGQASMVEHLIEKKAGLNAIVRFPIHSPYVGKTALHIAIEARQKEIVKRLIVSGANVNPDYGLTDVEKTTPLHIAIIQGYADAVHAILKSKPVEQVTLITYLNYAIAHDRRKIARLLLGRLTPPLHHTLMVHRAIVIDHLQAFCYFNDNQIAITELAKQAINQHAENIFSFLVAEYTDEIISDRDTFHALVQLASSNKNLVMLRLMLTTGALKLVANSNREPLANIFFAIKRGFAAAVVALYPEDQNQKDQEGLTPLMHAAKKNVEMATLLLTQGADINEVVTDSPHNRLIGKSALGFAIENGNTNVITVLINHGADTTFAMHQAAQKGNLDILKTVFNASQLETTDAQGRTPLMIATECGHRQLITYLLEAGANSEVAYTLAKPHLHHLFPAHQVPRPASPVVDENVAAIINKPNTTAAAILQNMQRAQSLAQTIMNKLEREQSAVDTIEQVATIMDINEGENEKLLDRIDELLEEQQEVTPHVKIKLDLAIKHNSVGRLAKALREHPELNTRHIEDKPLLDYLICYLATDLISWYLNQPSAVIKVSAVRRTIQQGDLFTLQRIVEKKRALLNKIIYQGQTMLMHAISVRRFNTVAWLMSLPDIDLTVVTESDNPYQNGLNAYGVACFQSAMEKPEDSLKQQQILQLFFNKSDFNKFQLFTKFDMLPAHVAAQAGNVGLLIEICKASPGQINMVTAEGLTPLMILIKRPGFAIGDLERFLEMQYDASHQVIPTLKINLNEKILIGDRPDYLGFTALHLAIAENKPSELDLLLRHGADHLIKNDDDMRPIDFATHIAALDAVDVLITHDPYHFDRDELIRRLEQNYRDMQPPGKKEMTLMQRCIYQQDFMLMKLLVEKRPQLILERDGQFNNAFTYARDMAFPQIEIDTDAFKTPEEKTKFVIEFKQTIMGFFECYFYIDKFIPILALHNAIDENNLAEIRDLIVQYPSILHMKNSFNVTPGMYARKQGKLEIARMLFAATIKAPVLEDVYHEVKKTIDVPPVHEVTLQRRGPRH